LFATGLFPLLTRLRTLAGCLLGSTALLLLARCLAARLGLWPLALRTGLFATGCGLGCGLWRRLRSGLALLAPGLARARSLASGLISPRCWLSRLFAGRPLGLPGLRRGLLAGFLT